MLMTLIHPLTTFLTQPHYLSEPCFGKMKMKTGVLYKHLIPELHR